MSIRRHFQGTGKIFVGSGSVTTTELAAGAEETKVIDDDNAVVGDMIIAQFDADAVDGDGTPAIINAWVSAAGKISVQYSNFHASDALPAEAKGVDYVILSVS